MNGLKKVLAVVAAVTGDCEMKFLFRFDISVVFGIPAVANGIDART